MYLACYYQGCGLLGQGFTCRVGRDHISIWHDKWIYDVYLCNAVTYVDINDVDLRFCDIFYSGVWYFKKKNVFNLYSQKNVCASHPQNS